jgi:hypothetical protein
MVVHTTMMLAGPVADQWLSGTDRRGEEFEPTDVYSDLAHANEFAAVAVSDSVKFAGGRYGVPRADWSRNRRRVTRFLATAMDRAFYLVCVAYRSEVLALADELVKRRLMRRKQVLAFFKDSPLLSASGTWERSYRAWRRKGGRTPRF